MLFVRRQIKDESSPGGPQYFIQGDTGVFRRLSGKSKEWRVRIVTPAGVYDSGLRLVTLESGSVGKDRFQNQQGKYDPIDKQVIDKFKISAKPADIWKIFFTVESVDEKEFTITIRPAQLEYLNGNATRLWPAGKAPPISVDPDPENAAFDIEDPPPKTQVTVVRVIRDTPKSKRLKEHYKHKCQVCGRTVLLANGGRYAEAHHLKPLGGQHQGVDSWDNMLVLCPNHHAMFDRGALALLPGKKAIEVVDGTGKATKTIGYLMLKPPHIINPKYISYHVDELYQGP